MSGDWHVPGELMERYAASRLEPALVMSVEAHLTRCGRCRAAVPYEEEWLAGSWERLAAELDRPRPRFAERLLRRAGVAEHQARLLAATPTLSRAWLAAVAVVGALAVVAGRLSGAGPEIMYAFLVMAPVLPLAGIAAAYGPHVDPVHELQAATPMAGPRLLLLRAGVVLVTAVVILGALSPFLPGPGALSVAWLLPSLALTAALLALSTRMPMAAAAPVLCAGWFAAVLSGGALSQDDLLFFSPGAQAMYGCAALALTALTYTRRRRLDPGEPR
ncbi:zf-HC2 domain-containing protein [Streptosporangium sp. KLBMP 9127]|nr:zf-HC2 domain-containing protein [Streptosporangium sp. KLBMP 9127]